MAELSKEVQEVVECIEEIQSDTTMPKNVKERLSFVIETLNSNDEDQTIRISKALDKIEEIVDDANLQPYTRTQIWNIATLLETL